MLSSFSVRKPFTVVVAVIIIAILGGVSLTNMSTDLLPSVNLPFAVVATTYIGAGPELVEMTVTRPIEQRMASVSNIKSIRSVSQENMSLVILEFMQSTNMDSAIIEIRESLDMLKAFMPNEVGASMIMRLNPDMMPVMVLSATVEGQSISESSEFLESVVIPQLESVEGIASVTVSGLIDNEIHIILKDEKIDEVNENIKKAIMASMPQLPQGQEMLGVPVEIPEITITKEMISGILKGQNFSMPAGYISEGDINYLVRVGDKINDFQQLRELTLLKLPIEGLGPIQLSDVAEIIMQDGTANRYSKVNGHDAITMVIQKQTEYSTADVAKSLRTRINNIMENNEGVKIIPLMDQGEYIDLVTNSMGLNLILGGVLAVLVLLLFLRDVKPTIIIGFSIPISIVTAFVMMYFSNITLNIISMGGLALGVGMLVDNSIVVIENIYRMRSEGINPTEAAIAGAKQVTGAITASTLTTVAVFTPILFTQGLTRDIFTDMGLTIAFSLGASLVIALTLVPMIASNLLIKNVNKEHKIFEGIKNKYIKLLTFSLRHKALVMVLVLVLFIGSVMGAMNTGTELFPASDSGQLNATLIMPTGTKFEEIVKAADEVSYIISLIEDVEVVGGFIGGGLFPMGNLRGSGGDSVSFYILLKENRKNSTSEVAQLIRDKTENANYQITVSDAGMDLSAMRGGTIVIDIRGNQFDTLQAIAEDVAEIVASVSGTIDISNGIEETSPELRIIVDKERSIYNGLTVAQVFMEINKRLANETAVTTLSMGNRSYDIFVKDTVEARSLSRRDITNLEIITPQGDVVYVKDIADIEEAEGFSSIRRTNQQRHVTVTAELKEGYNVGIVSNEISERLSQYTTPTGYTIHMGGEREAINDSFRDLFLMLLLAIAFIYLIMVAQFQSLLSPFIVMFTIPLAFTGGFIALIATRYPISVIAFVGFIILSGVVVNNGIVFVDYINKMREMGLSKNDAILKAGMDRIRPILMTALTTIFALSTMSVGAGMGTEMIQPMAITAIGGLIYSTLLTLILIPVLYDAFNRKEKSNSSIQQ